MKIVKFKNGTYGIRKLTLFGYRFRARSENYWCGHSNVVNFCQFKSLDDARKMYEAQNDYGDVVK